jgi:dTDP-4-dehydrorhamnose reductase
MLTSKPQILIIGSTGFLGSALLSGLKSAVGMDRSLVDLSQPLSPSAIDAIKTGNHQFVVICAAITDVETCFKDRERSHRINVDGTIELLNVIRQTGSTPICRRHCKSHKDCVQYLTRSPLEWHLPSWDASHFCS